MIERTAQGIVKAQTRAPWTFVIVFIILTALIAPGIFQLVGHVEPSLEKVLPQNVDEVKTMNNMRTQFGADMMYILVYAEGPVSDVRNPNYLRYVDTLAEKLRTREHILEVNTLADLAKTPEGVLPNSLVENKQILGLNPQTPRYVNSDYSFSVMEIRSDTGASAELIGQVVDDIEEDIAATEHMNPGARTEITGFNAIDKATFEVIMSDFAKITGVSMILVGLVVFFTFRSLVKGMLPMVVVMAALVWTMGIVGYLGLTITVVSMVAAAMIMGLGIDFGIHVVHTYYENKRHQTAPEALRETMQELLRAMLGASMTTIAGFLALLFGVLPAMKILGIILGLGILTTLISAVFLLPALVYLYDTRLQGGTTQ